MPRIKDALSFVAGCLVVLASQAVRADAPRCTSLELAVAFVSDPPERYVKFCAAHPKSCILDGASLVEWTEELYRLLNRVNAETNDKIALTSDWERHGIEDSWDLPSDCKGDCEDIALQKREDLASIGVPRASLTLAIVFHEVEFFPHAVLLVETTTGTWVLDNEIDEVVCWDNVPYRFTHRERTDGRWTRFRIY